MCLTERREPVHKQYIPLAVYLASSITTTPRYLERSEMVETRTGPSLRKCVEIAPITNHHRMGPKEPCSAHAHTLYYSPGLGALARLDTRYYSYSLVATTDFIDALHVCIPSTVGASIGSQTRANCLKGNYPTVGGQLSYRWTSPSMTSSVDTLERWRKLVLCT